MPPAMGAAPNELRLRLMAALCALQAGQPVCTSGLNSVAGGGECSLPASLCNGGPNTRSLGVLKLVMKQFVAISAHAC